MDLKERILFREHDHVYFYETNLGETVQQEKFTSVTTILSKLSPKKDFDKIAQDYYEKFVVNGSLDILFKDIGKKNKMSIAECYDMWGELDYSDHKCIVKIWEDIKVKAAEKGTAYHLLRENEAYAKGAKSLITEGEFKVGHNLKTLEGNYSELILFHPFYKVSGSADVVEFKENKSFDIQDYKGLALDTPIATKTGWKNMIDIKVNDEIFDGDGKLTKVKNISEIHYNPCYEITFDTGDKIVCDHEHRWVITESNEYRKTQINTELTTEELKLKFDSKTHPIYIPCVKLELPDIELPIDPYVLGLWLGDGNRTCGTITCIVKEIWDEIKRRGYEVSENHNENLDKAESRTVYKLRGELVKLNLLGNKHIPDIYFRSSYNQRLDLLRGFMDADGHFHRKRKRIATDTTKEWQANSIMQLCSSLGFKPIKFNCTTTGFGKDNIPTFHICFSSDVNPFLIRNKDYFDVIGNKNFTNSKRRYIKDIKLIETVPTKCLEVESETHCYLAGYNLIKTHNTNKKKPEQKSFKNEKLLTPVSHLLNCDYDKYNLQLSIYAFILEEYGYKCGKLELIWIKDAEKDIREYIPVKYLRDEAKAILTYFKNNGYKL